MKTCRLILILILWSPLGTAIAQDLQYVGSTLWSGMCDIAVRGDHAYIVYPNGLVVFDISDPTSPLLLSREFIPGKCSHLDILGNYAYIACRMRGLTIFDISNPANPSLISTTQTVGQVQDVCVVGQYAYLADDSLGLMVYEISDPSSPQMISNVYGPGEYRTNRLIVDGDFAYVGAGQGGGWPALICVYDVTNPANPIMRDTTSAAINPSALTGLMVIGNYIFTVTHDSYSHWGAFNSFDISSPDNPVLASYNVIPYGLNDIYFDGNIVYVVAEEYGVFAYNVSDPFHPALLGTYYCPGDILRGTAVSDGYAYIVGDNDLQVVNMLNPEEPYLAGSFIASSRPRDLAVIGHYAYVIDPDYLYIVDIDDMANPVVIGSCDLAGDPYNICIDGNYAYIANSSSGLQVVDIGDPLVPSLVGFYSGNFQARDIYVKDHFAFLTSDRFGLLIFNVEDPTIPRFAAIYENSNIQNTCFEGDYAYIFSYDFGHNSEAKIEIVNIETPFAPTLVGVIDSSYYRTSLYAKWPYLYTQENYQLHIYDIHDRSQPELINHPDTIRCEGIYTLSGNYLYLLYSYSYISIVDIANPNMPLEVLSTNISEDPNNLFVQDGYCFMAGRNSFAIYASDFTSAMHDMELPSSSIMLSSYPNPFNASATLKYYLQADGRVTIDIYNIIGQRVTTLVNNIQRAGEHQVIWNADDVPSGVYLARLALGANSKTIKMVLLK